MTSVTTTSPWQHALGDRYRTLDPRLRSYFGPIPAGSVGRGSGVFEVVGTPRRWLWPVFAVLGRAEVLFPVWQKDVEFSVINRPGDRLIAERTFSFPGGARTMRDAVSWQAGTLRDTLGKPPRVDVALIADVVDGGLHLRSRRTSLILGRIRIPMPTWMAPRLSLSETIGPDGRQRVEFTLDAPLIGRIYEYRGSFDYEVHAE